MLIGIILGKVHAEIEKRLLTSVWENGLNKQKCQNFDLSTFKNDL